MASLKQSKPDIYNSNRDALKDDAWIYQVNTYLNLLTPSNSKLNLTEKIKVQYASTWLKRNADIRYFTQVQAGHTPKTWESFKNGLRAEFVFHDDVRQK